MSAVQFNSIKSYTSFLPDSHIPNNISGTALGEIGQGKVQLPPETQTSDVHSFQRAERSSTIEELQQHPVFGSLWQNPKQEAPSQLETTRTHRLAILAREFEGTNLTREDHARLAILTQRLRRLNPKITAKSWTIVEEEVSELETISSQIESISKRYGL